MTNADIIPQTVKPDELARVANVGLSTVYQWADARLIPTSRVGRTVRIPLEFVERFARGEVDLPTNGKAEATEPVADMASAER